MASFSSCSTSRCSLLSSFVLAKPTTASSENSRGGTTRPCKQTGLLNASSDELLSPREKSAPHKQASARKPSLFSCSTPRLKYRRHLASAGYTSRLCISLSLRHAVQLFYNDAHKSAILLRISSRQRRISTNHHRYTYRHREPHTHSTPRR